MCGRYSIIETSEIYDRFGLKESQKSPIRSNYNAAPGQNLPVVILEENKVKLTQMRWGLIPPWAKDERIGYAMINAKSETLMEKPTWRSPFKSRRCLVPASGFYEWLRNGDDKKEPHYFHLPAQPIFFFAGLYEIAKGAEDFLIYSFSIVTTKPNKTVGRIHDRMPAILARDKEKEWLEPNSDPEYLLTILQPYPDQAMEEYTVRGEVGNSKNNYPELIYPVS